MKIKIGLHQGVKGYPVAIWDNKGLMLKKRDNVSKDEISSFMDKRFDSKEKEFLKKAIKFFKPKDIVIQTK